MIYCLSDLHGVVRGYMKFVQEELRNEDTAYIVGDVLDRGTGGIEILLDIMKRPNVHLILGNHEYMMREALKENATYGALLRWYKNGGRVTEKRFQKLSTKTQQEILDYLDNCPDHVDICVNDRWFHLVHGWPADSTFNRVWSRCKEKNPMSGKTVIIGHTVTTRIAENVQDAMDDGHICIYPKPQDRERLDLGYIAIDCGCG